MINLNQKIEDSKFYNKIREAIELYPFEDANYVRELFIKQTAENQNLRNRKNFEAHLSTKTFIFTEDFSKVLLLNHKTLGRWLQAGGHVDEEDQSVWEAGRREGLEETGISNLKYLPINPSNLEVPIDLDLHNIPPNQKKQEPSHLHYGFSYIFVAQDTSVNIDESESTDYKWINWEEFANMEQFKTIARKVTEYKTKIYQENAGNKNG
jgi:8-oxo-dGTP pyrophosphatase MutT (NUDIX family)